MVNVQASNVETKRGFSAPAKFYILIALTTLLGLVSSYLFSAGNFVYGAVFLVLFLSFFIIEALFIFSKPYLATGVALNSIAFAFPFLRLLSMYFLVGFAVFVLFLLHGAYRGRSEIDNMLKIRFTRLVRVISRSMITAVVVFLGIIIVLSNNFSISRESVDKTIKLSAPIIERFIEGFDGEVNTGTFLKQITERELRESEAFIALSVRDRQIIVERQAIDLKLRIEKSIGAAINLDASISENIYEIIDTKLSGLEPRAQIYWSVILIATLWLSVQSVEFIIYIPLTILVFLIYELLFVLKFATMQMETRSKELISLK